MTSPTFNRRRNHVKTHQTSDRHDQFAELFPSDRTVREQQQALRRARARRREKLWRLFAALLAIGFGVAIYFPALSWISRQ